jgi:hypothetical protein
LQPVVTLFREAARTVAPNTSLKLPAPFCVEARGAGRLGNESFFSAPKLARDPWAVAAAMVCGGPGMIRWLPVAVACLGLACQRSDKQRQVDATATRAEVFVQCVISTQRNGDPSGPVTYEEWEQSCKNSPTSAELSAYLAAHSDLPRGLSSFLQALAVREDERQAQTR